MPEKKKDDRAPYDGYAVIAAVGLIVFVTLTTSSRDFDVVVGGMLRTADDFAPWVKKLAMSDAPGRFIARVCVCAFIDGMTMLVILSRERCSVQPAVFSIMLVIQMVAVCIGTLGDVIGNGNDANATLVSSQLLVVSLIPAVALAVHAMCARLRRDEKPVDDESLAKSTA